MFNVLLDAMPDEWDGYPVDTDFRIGIQISQCLVDDALNSREKVATALSLLFPKEQPHGTEFRKNSVQHSKLETNTASALMYCILTVKIHLRNFLSHSSIKIQPAKQNIRI